MNASENAATSYIGRWVAFLIIPVVGAFTAWLGAHGLDLDPAEVTAWVIGVVGGATTWLYNRGKYEAAKATGLDEETIQRIVETTIREKLPPAPQGPPQTAADARRAGEEFLHGQ